MIVDELHALLRENKRGVHLTGLAGASSSACDRKENPLCRIGLSATVAPLEKVGKFLTGSGPECGDPRDQLRTPCVDRGDDPDTENMHIRRRDTQRPGSSANMANIVDRNRATLIFTNTRSGAERISHRLKIALPNLHDTIECHHSSLDRDIRQEVEDRLKDGELRAVVCSTSLELG